MDFLISLFPSKIKAYLFLVAFVLLSFGFAYIAINRKIESNKSTFEKTEKVKFDSIEKYEKLKIK